MFAPGIVVNNQAADIFQGSVNNFTIKNWAMTGFGTPTAGWGVNIAGQNLTVDSVSVNGLYSGIRIDPNNSVVFLRRLWARSVALLALQIGGGGASVTNLDDYMYDGGAAVPYSALQVTGGGALLANNLQIFGAANCISLEPNGTVLASADFTTASIDHCTTGLLSSPTGGGTVQRITYTAGKITSHSSAGVAVTGNTQGLKLTAVQLYDNQSPIFISGSGNNGITGTSLTLAGNRGPIFLSAGQNGFKFDTSLMGPYDGWPNNVGCITVATGSSDWYSISNITCNNAAPRTSGIVDGGTGTNKSVVNNVQ